MARTADQQMAWERIMGDAATVASQQVTYWDEYGTRHTFADDDAAHAYAHVNRVCLSDAEGREVYCRRWDH